MLKSYTIKEANEKCLLETTFPVGSYQLGEVVECHGLKGIIVGRLEGGNLAMFIF